MSEDTKVEEKTEDFSEQFFLELLQDENLWGGAKNPMNRRINLLNNGLTNLIAGLHHKALQMNPSALTFRLHILYSSLQHIVQEITQNINKQTNVNAASKMLNEKYKLIKQGLDFYDSIDPSELNIGVSSATNLSDLFVNAIINTEDGQIENALINQINSLETSVNQRVREGIDDLTKIKEGLNLEKNYGKFIKDTARTYQFSRHAHYVLFIGCLVGVVVLTEDLLSSVKEVDGQQINWQFFIMRVLIMVPILWAAKFFHENYKQAFVGQIKFENIKSLLGGGIDSAVNYIDDEDAKRDALKKFGNSIVDMSDLTNMVANRSFKPEDALKQARAVADIARDIKKQD